MKLAISGKGGVGKTTFAALLIKTLSEQGKRVLAIDADPDANLAAALGIPNPQSIVPISDMKELIEERTGAKPGSVGGFFKLNPRVDDLPEKCSVEVDHIKFMRLGGVKKGGSGCICPESTLLKALVAHILLARDEVVVMDMEAGIEHLGRATASATDKLIVVVEPGRRSVETAQNIKRLAAEIGLSRIFLVGNKIRGQTDQEFLERYVTGFEWLGFLPYDEKIIECDLSGKPPYDTDTPAKKVVQEIVQTLIRGGHEHQHAHSHEHTHAHAHEHQHEDVVHMHEHSHTYIHEHAHQHSHEDSQAADGRSHDHDDNEDHSAHDHDHSGHEAEPHDHPH
jgi:CO dehydrogenase maturation factor